MKVRKKPDSESAELSASADRIVAIAAKLFAEHGYEGVSTRQLAAAVGLSVATVNYHVGSKRELYDKVIRFMDREEEVLVRKFVERFGRGLEAGDQALGETIFELVEAFVDLNVNQPNRAGLYMRRWLAPGDELPREEVSSYLALYQSIEEVMARAQTAGVVRGDLQVRQMLRSIDWFMCGYFVSGAVDAETWRGDPRDGENLAAFKAFLRDYVFRMTGLPEVSEVSSKI